MNIPTIIQSQLFTDINKIWSWGAHGWVATEQNTLSFKVDAHHFKGIVSIALNESQDLYEIRFFGGLAANLRNFRAVFGHFDFS